MKLRIKTVLLTLLAIGSVCLFTACGSEKTPYDINDEAITTNVNAPPIPIAFDVFFETPKKGQIPRNPDRIILETKIAPIENVNNSIFYVLLCFI